VNQPPTPIELFRILIRSLCAALETQSLAGRLARPLMSLILHRVITISHRIRRFIERIEAGRPFPRRRGAVARPAAPRKHTPDPLPRKVGWLGPLLPDVVLLRGQLSGMLEKPEMKALMAAAPEQMGRALRPLCRMLGLEPPPSIALPPRRRPIRAKSPPRPAEPKWPHDPRPRDRFGFYKGPPPDFASIARHYGPPRRKPA
jgi:hypothetical protein